MQLGNLEGEIVASRRHQERQMMSKKQREALDAACVELQEESEQ